MSRVVRLGLFVLDIDHKTNTRSIMRQVELSCNKMSQPIIDIIIVVTLFSLAPDDAIVSNFLPPLRSGLIKFVSYSRSVSGLELSWFRLKLSVTEIPEQI